LALLHHVDADGIAGELQRRLNDRSLTELAARAGQQPGYYVHETDAANEVVAGLHRCCDAPEATVPAYAGPDTPGEHAV